MEQANAKTRHYLLPKLQQGKEMISEAKNQDYTGIVSTMTGLKAVTKWFLLKGILGYYSLAREMHADEVGLNVRR
jgi:hypothetical protein